jgi:hypothetical protein
MCCSMPLIDSAVQRSKFCVTAATVCTSCVYMQQFKLAYHPPSVQPLTLPLVSVQCVNANRYAVGIVVHQLV